MLKNKQLLPFYLKGLVSGKFTLKQAAESTGYSVRWLSYLKGQYALHGDLALVSKAKGRVAHNRTSEDIRTKVAATYASDLYKDINWTYYTKCLKDFESIDLSTTTVRAILKEYGYKSPEAHKIKRVEKVHRPRLRREHEGDLIQIDGSNHPWFYKSGDMEKYTIHGAIDDATGKITALYMTKNECLYGYMEMLRITLTTYGVPREIYSDRAGLFCYPPRDKDKLTLQEQLDGIKQKHTQWQRVLEELSIRQVLAWTPQAKGRVERMWSTLQGQLPLYFAKHGVKTIDQANKLLPEFIKQFNSSFAREPDEPTSYYRAAPENLDSILCAKFSRLTNSCGVMSFHNVKFRMVGALKVRHLTVTLCVSVRGIYVEHPDGKRYEVEALPDTDYNGSSNESELVEAIKWKYLYSFAKDKSF